MLLALLMILKWRRTVSDGMEAIVPNNLMDSLNKFSGNQISLAKWLESNISKINLDLAKQSEVVSILKKELAIKEDELSKFKQLNLTRDSEILVSKVVKLHSNLSKLSSQIDSGLITQNGAIIFLKDELADVFEELGISQISPAIGLPVKDLPNEGFTIKSTVPVSDQNMHLTVANLVESGYIFTSNGHTKVIRPAIITVNKFGE
jgi:molecular chaperone GrpE (heat shock protein)